MMEIQIQENCFIDFMIISPLGTLYRPYIPCSFNHRLLDLQYKNSSKLSSLYNFENFKILFRKSLFKGSLNAYKKI